MSIIQSPRSKIQNRKPVRWPLAVNILLGTWLLSSPMALGYRNAGMFWNDLLCGGAVLLLSLLALASGWKAALWGLSLIGLWLLFAPLVFWASTAVAYANDTLIGVLVIGLSILIPGNPVVRETEGPDRPAGWSYNPSAWKQRVPISAFAFISFLISSSLAAYQLGYIPTIWEPFFGAGTVLILESKVSKAFPVSDAGLGAVSYLVEALAGFIGGTRRWRTMPWMVLLFGFFIVPVGFVSVVLVILQPVAVGAWCTLCLITAVLMLVMIPPAVDEVAATFQFLWQTKRAGQSAWKALWRGGPGTFEGEVATPSVPHRGPGFGSVKGVPLHLLLCSLLGIGLMAAPSLLCIEGTSATNHYVMGALIVSFSVTAMAEVTRSIRYLNLLFGVEFIISAWLLPGHSVTASVWSTLAGIALTLLSLPRGPVKESYGVWNRYIV